MKRHLGLVAALFVFSGMIYAAPITLTGLLSGANENPATGSPGTGVATVTLDPSIHSLTVDIVFSDLFLTTPSGAPSGTTAAHIHCCAAPPANAGVATAVPTFPGFPLGVTSGTYHQTFDLLQASSYNPAFITANGGTAASADVVLENGLLNNQTYLNVHTTAFGGGEIRAFLEPVPEPATATLALAAFAAMGLMVRRRRVRG